MPRRQTRRVMPAITSHQARLMAGILPEEFVVQRDIHSFLY